MTNTSPKGQRVPTQLAEGGTSSGGGGGGPTLREQAWLGSAPRVGPLLPLPVPLNIGAGLTNYGPLSNSNILDTTMTEKLPDRILTEKERERAHGEGHLLGILRPCYCRRDRMSRGLRQKRRSHGWETEVAQMGSRWAGGRDGGPFSETRPLVGRGIATYLAPGGPQGPRQRGRLQRGGHTEGSGARPWGHRTLFVNWTQAGQGDP